MSADGAYRARYAASLCWFGIVFAVVAPGLGALLFGGYLVVVQFAQSPTEVLGALPVMLGFLPVALFFAYIFGVIPAAIAGLLIGAAASLVRRKIVLDGRAAVIGATCAIILTSWGRPRVEPLAVSHILVWALAGAAVALVCTRLAGPFWDTPSAAEHSGASRD